MKIIKESVQMNIQKIDMYDAPNYKDETRKAWQVISPGTDMKVFIEQREYFDNWNDKLDIEYAIYYDPSQADLDGYDSEEYYEEKFKDAKLKANEILSWVTME